MAIKKFKVTVTRTDEYEVEIDDQLFDEKYRAEYSEVFGTVETLEDVVENVTVAFMRTDSDFIEGYGYIKSLRKDGSHSKLFYNDAKKGLSVLPDELYVKGLSIKTISSDYDYNTDIEPVQ